MARFLMAWELGGGHGHLASVGRLAELLVRNGHEVIVATTDLVGADVFLPEGVTLLAAPRANTPWRGEFLGWADALRPYGWTDPALLRSAVQAWRGLVRLARPDIVIADSAPTLMLALKGSDTPVVGYNIAWSAPPDETPIPRPASWLPAETERVQRRENELLRVVREAVGPMDALAEVFQVPSRWLIHGLAESDPFAGRRSVPTTYLGPVAALDRGAPTAFPEGDGPCVFAYLKKGFTGTVKVLEAITKSRARAVIYLSGVQTVPKTPSRIRVSTKPVRIQDIVHADVAITHGGAGTSLPFLLRGGSILQFPMQLEQTVCAMRLAQLGGVVVVPPAETIPAEKALTIALGSETRAKAKQTARDLAFEGTFESLALAALTW